MVDVGDGVVGEQRVGSPGELQVVARYPAVSSLVMPVMVRRTVIRCSSAARVPRPILAAQRGLAEKYCGEWGFGVEPVIGQ